MLNKKDFLKYASTLAFPIMIQNLISTLVNIADTVMLGYVRILKRIENVVGQPVTVLSGVDEARLTFLAARRWYGWDALFHHKYLPSEFLKYKKSRWRGGERHRISETALRHFPTKIDKRKTAKAL